MNFGKWIVVAFVLFTVYIGVLVFICVRQDVSLVSRDYYQEELAYQEKLNRKENANQLAEAPEIEARDGQIMVSLHNNSAIEKGVLMVQRPANQKLDRKFSLSPNEDVQHFKLEQWEPGLYRATLNWTMNGKDYFVEKLIVL